MVKIVTAMTVLAVLLVGRQFRETIHDWSLLQQAAICLPIIGLCLLFGWRCDVSDRRSAQRRLDASARKEGLPQGGVLLELKAQEALGSEGTPARASNR